MASPLLTQNRSIAEPSLIDVLEMTKRDVMLSLNCHALGTIQSFSASDQTASVSINYKMTFLERDDNGLYQPKQRNYPVLIDCPVIVLQGAQGALTMPIAVGDTCLVIFNDRDISQWLASGQIGPVPTQVLHDISDGIVLVGLRSRARPIEDYDTERAVLRNGDASVSLATDDFEMTNGASTVASNAALLQIKNTAFSLGGILTELNTLLTTLTTVMTGSVSPPVTPYEIAVAAASTTAIASIVALQVKVTGLLE